MAAVLILVRMLGFAAVCVNQVAGQHMNTAGRDFFIAFMGLNEEDKQYSTATVFLTNPNDAPAEVHMEFLGFEQNSETVKIAAFSTNNASLPRNVILSSGDLHRESAYVTSTLDIYVQVSLAYVSLSLKSLAGYPVFPTSSLGAEYIVATHCESGECVFLVTATEDDTEVRINMRISEEYAVYSGSRYYDNDTFTERLQRGESLLVTCNECDMTGSHVRASGKVAVVAGGDYTQLERGSANSDALAEQMLPLESLGTRYVLGSSYQDLHIITKVVVFKSGESFLYNGTKQRASSTERQMFTFTSKPTSAEVTTIQSESPLLVVQIIGSSEERPATSMYVAVPWTLWSDAYRVYLPLPDGKRHDAFLCLVMQHKAEYSIEEIVADNTGGAKALREDQVSKNSVNTTEAEFNVLRITVEKASLLSIQAGLPFTGYVIYSNDYRSSVLPLLWDLRRATPVHEIRQETTSAAAIKTFQDTSHRTTLVKETSVSSVSSSAVTETLTAGDLTDSSPAPASTTESNSGTAAHAEQGPPEALETTLQPSPASTTPENNIETTEQTSDTARITTQEVVSENGTRDEKSSHVSSATMSEVNDTTPPEVSGAGYHPEQQGSTDPTAEDKKTVFGTAASRPISAKPAIETTPSSSSSPDEQTLEIAASVNLPTTTAIATGKQQNKPKYPRAVTCKCLKKNPVHRNATSKGFDQEVVQRLKDELLKDRKSLSTYAQTKGCAPDARMSSAVIGTIAGVVVFVMCFAFIVIPDLASLCRHVAAATERKIGACPDRQRKCLM